MGTKPKKDEVVTTATFFIVEDKLGVTITEDQCTALAWQIAGELEDVHEVHVQKIGLGKKHALIVFVIVPEGMRDKNGARLKGPLGALVKQVDNAVYEMASELLLSKERSKTASKTRAASPARRR